MNLLRGKQRVAVLCMLVWLAAGTAQAQEPRKFVFRAAHYEVSVTLNPAEQALTARATVEFIPSEPSRTVLVELHPGLTLAAVLGGDGKPVEFARDADTPLLVRVTLPQPATSGQKLVLTFDYSGPLASEENSPIKNVRVAYVGHEGAYLLLPARWFPLTDYLSNRYTAVFQITVPEGWSVAGTGAASAPTLKAASAPAAQATSKEAQPVPAGMTFAFRVERPEAAGTFLAGNFQTVPVSAQGANIPVYVPAGAVETAAGYGEAAARIMEFFSAEFGALAEMRLSVAQLPEGTPLDGYAAPGLLLIGPRQWDPRVNTRLLARLAAQQWWGGEVMPASASDVWLSEGLARYSEALYAQHAAGEEGFQRALEEFAIAALMYEEAAPIAQAVQLEPYSSEYRSVVVNKGAVVFHMLRSQMGEEAFRELLRGFYLKFAGRAARLEDFEQLAQEKLQQMFAAQDKEAPNLRPFFTQWLNSTGVPEFKLDYIVKRTRKGFRVEGEITHGLETFRMPVNVKVETEGNPEFKSIEIIGAKSSFTIETFGRPKPGGIILDPNNNLLKSSPRMRVRASIARGEELAAEGQFYEAIQHYQRALELQKNNSLASFRIGEAFFYQKNFQAAANAFRDAIDGDREPSYMWVEVWSHIYLGKIFDLSGQRERAVNEYTKARELNDNTRGAQDEADRYLKEPYKEESRPANP